MIIYHGNIFVKEFFVGFTVHVKNTICEHAVKMINL